MTMKVRATVRSDEGFGDLGRTSLRQIAATTDSLSHERSR